MDPVVLALVGIAAMFILIMLHVPLGIAMGVSGVIGFALMADIRPALSLLASETSGSLSSIDLATIPLFILMGGFASAAGLSEDLYKIAFAWIGHRRGGLSMATIGGAAGFGAVCGSSIATTATFGKVAYPSMIERRYSRGFAAGTIAAGGTLGILVPPSVAMVVYAVLARELIVTLYIAAIVPAVIAVVLHFIAINAYVRLRPDAAPSGPRLSWNERVSVLRGGWAVIGLIAVLLGGISFGIFTANEAAAVGAGLAFLVALLRGRLNRDTLKSALLEAASTTAMIFIIIVGAALFGYFIAVTQAPQALLTAIKASGWPVPVVLALMMLLFLALGAVFDEMATMVITLPFVLPLIVSWGYDPVWWGVINIVVIELGMLIPPIGLNIFVIYSLVKNVPLSDIYRGVAPFIISNLVRLTLLLSVPALSLWLPSMLRG